jgi:hypothetical protein
MEHGVRGRIAAVATFYQSREEEEEDENNGTAFPKTESSALKKQHTRISSTYRVVTPGSKCDVALRFF